MLWRYFPFISWQTQVFRRRDRTQCCVNGLHVTESGTVFLGLNLAPGNKSSARNSPRLAHFGVRLLTVVLRQSVTQGWLITVSWTRKWSTAGFIHAKLWKAGIKSQPVSQALPALSVCAQLHSVLETKQTQVAPGHCHGKGVVKIMTFQKDLLRRWKLVFVSQKKKNTLTVFVIQVFFLIQISALQNMAFQI